MGQGFGRMEKRHYLKAGRSVGDYLRQVVKVRGQPVAPLAWGPACYALKDRDRWLDWSATQRVEHSKLIVQNRRFILLTEKGEVSNLAPQTLAAAAGPAGALAAGFWLPAVAGSEFYRSRGVCRDLLQGEQLVARRAKRRLQSVSGGLLHRCCSSVLAQEAYVFALLKPERTPSSCNRCAISAPRPINCTRYPTCHT